MIYVSCHSYRWPKTCHHIYSLNILQELLKDRAARNINGTKLWTFAIALDPDSAADFFKSRSQYLPHLIPGGSWDRRWLSVEIMQGVARKDISKRFSSPHPPSPLSQFLPCRDRPVASRQRPDISQISGNLVVQFWPRFIFALRCAPGD